MQSPNKSRKKYCYSIEAETLCQDYASDQIQTAKQRYCQMSQRRDSNTALIRRDEYLNELSDIEITMKQHAHQLVQYQRKIEKNKKLSRKYGKQSRLSQIMNIKVKTSPCLKSRPERIKQKFQQDQTHSSKQSLQTIQPESISRNKVTRFQQIMNIKVNKPSVCSTLVNYQPKKVYIMPENSAQRIKRSSSAIQDKENEVQQKNGDQADRRERTWRLSERKRQIQMKYTQMADQRVQKQERRKELMFDNLLSKQIIKIQRERELTKRKNEGFSKYLFPYY